MSLLGAAGAAAPDSTTVVAIGGLLLSVATLILSFLTFKWTQRQNLVETFDLVPYWKWYKSREIIGAQAKLGCHNRSSKSIFVTKIEFLTQGYLFLSPPMQGVFYDSPVENHLPQIIKSDENFEFQIDVSSAIQSIDFSRRSVPLLYKLDRHSLWVRVTTASGTYKQIRAREFIPPDVLEHYIAIGKTHGRI